MHAKMKKKDRIYKKLHNDFGVLNEVASVIKINYRDDF